MKSLFWRVLWSLLIVLGALVYQEILLPAPADSARAVLETRGVGFALLLGGVLLKILHYFYSRGYFPVVQAYICSSPGKYFWVFSCLYFLIRLPFYTIPFFEEDAYHANIFLTSPPGPEFFLTGWIDGASYFTAPTHPAMLYLLLSWLGTCFRLFIDLPQLNEFWTVVVSRWSFSLFQYVFWLGFLGIYFYFRNSTEQKSPAEKLFLTGVLLLSMSPLAIQNSIDLQTDNTSGVLLNGLFFLLFWFHQRSTLGPAQFAGLLFVASFLVGLGKNEWGLAFFAAALLFVPVSWGAAKVFSFSTKEKLATPWIFLLSLSGLLLGHLASYYYDPLNYMGGWHVFKLFGSKGNIAGTYGLSRWIELTFQRLPYLLPVYAFMAMIGWGLLCNRKLSGSVANTLPILFLATFFGGYFLSSWGAYPRYFATALIGIAVVFGFYHREILAGIKAATILRLYVFLIICSVFYIAQGWGEMSLRKDWQPKPLMPALLRTDCVPIVESSEGYRKSKPNFVTTEGAKDWAASQGKGLCPR